jgi:hypothetical protein
VFRDARDACKELDRLVRLRGMSRPGIQRKANGSGRVDPRMLRGDACQPSRESGPPVCPPLQA